MKRPRRPGGGRGREGDRAPGSPEGDEEDRTDTGAADERPTRPQTGGNQRGEAAGGSSRAARRSLGDRVGKAAGSDAGKGTAAGRPKPADPASAPAPAAGAKARTDGAAKAGKGGTDSAQPERESKPESKRAPARELNRPRRQAETRPRDRDAGPKGGDGKAKPGRRRQPVTRARERRSGADRRDRRARAGARSRPRARAGAAAFATALRRAATRTRGWAAANAPKAGRRLLAALAAAFAVFFAALGIVLSVLIGIGRVFARPVRAVLGVLDRATRAASKALTPDRALAVVVAGAAILLALSQYADYRSVSIGNDAYSGVQTVAPAPETGRAQAGDAHSYVFVPVAIACLLLLAVATVGGRRRACRLITLAGIAAVLVALIVDRPAGLDPGETAVAFEGVRATLIGGFYAQIAAGILLIGSSTLLARELRLATGSQRSPVRDRTAGPAPERPRRRPRAGTDPEGAARA